MFTITSLAFYAFIIAALLLYYLLPKCCQWAVLLLCSIAFVLFSSGIAAFIFLGVDIAAVYLGTVLTAKTENAKKRNVFTAVSIVIVVLVLCALKYWNNVSEWAGGLLTAIGLPVWQCAWIAPVGISYFSLSAIGYMLDVNWKACTVERNPLKLALLIIWFPALICGPVTRYSDLRESVFAAHRFDYDKFKFGAYRMLYGLFKKLVISNRIAIFTTAVFNSQFNEYRGVFFPVAAVLYAFQIYSDFSGCMDIMLGVSEMFQITMPENFQRPFFSQSLSEFWRRWHITLGQWAKDYVMYPLLKSRALIALGDKCKKLFGKKQGKKVPTYVGMLILWLVIGFWHGGTLKHLFACGILLWFFIVGGQLCQPLFDKLGSLLHVDKSRFSYKLFASLRTLFLMCVTWTFFNAESVSQGFWRLKNTLLEGNWYALFDRSMYQLGLTLDDFVVVLISFIIVLVISVMQEKGIKIRETFEKQGLVFRWLVLLGGIFAIIIFGVYGPGYNAVDFIYRG